MKVMMERRFDTFFENFLNLIWIIIVHTYRAQSVTNERYSLMIGLDLRVISKNAGRIGTLDMLFQRDRICPRDTNQRE